MNEQPQRPIQDQPRVEQGTIPDDTRTQSAQSAQEEDTGFLPDDRMASLRERWDTVQAGFVDDPQNAVQQAHGLVNELVDNLVQTFTQERTTLENQWKGGGTADTETLRVALQRYRSLFNRLLGT